MDPNELVKLLRKQPFEPFCLRLVDGRIFDVRHPEFMMVHRTSIFLFLSGRGEPPFDDWVIFSPYAIATLHPLAAA